MSKQNLIPEDLDAWQSEHHLDRMRAPARHAVAAWALVAVIAIAALVGPPTAREAAAGLVELRHAILMLDSEFERVGVRFQTARRVASPVYATPRCGMEPGHTECA